MINPCPICGSPGSQAFNSTRVECTICDFTTDPATWDELANGLVLSTAITTIEKWQANLTVTYILDQWYASANDIHVWQPTLAELLIDLASKLEAQP